MGLKVVLCILTFIKSAGQRTVGAYVSIIICNYQSVSVSKQLNNDGFLCCKHFSLFSDTPYLKLLVIIIIRQ
jgi:hypothetical protein